MSYKKSFETGTYNVDQIDLCNLSYTGSAGLFQKLDLQPDHIYVFTGPKLNYMSPQDHEKINKKTEQEVAKLMESNGFISNTTSALVLKVPATGFDAPEKQKEFTQAALEIIAALGKGKIHMTRYKPAAA